MFGFQGRGWGKSDGKVYLVSDFTYSTCCEILHEDKASVESTLRDTLMKLRDLISFLNSW